MNSQLKAIALATTMFVTGLAYAPTVQASDDNLSLYQANQFIQNLNTAINSKDLNETHSFLNLRIPNYGTFGTVETLYHHPGYAYNEWGSTLDPHNVAYGRYPGFAHPHYNTVGLRKLGKGDFIGSIVNKKTTIPNYNMQIEVISSRKSEAGSVVMEVNVREYSAAYNPHHSHLAYSHSKHNGHVYSSLNSVSKCNVRLDKKMEAVYLTQMDCKYL